MVFSKGKSLCQQTTSALYRHKVLLLVTSRWLVKEITVVPLLYLVKCYNKTNSIDVTNVSLQ